MTAKHTHYDVIRKPIITEKATMASEHNAVVFEVAYFQGHTKLARLGIRGRGACIG